MIFVSEWGYGRLFSAIEKPNVTRSTPFLQFIPETLDSDPYLCWDETWEPLSGWKLEIVAQGAAHSRFTDLPLLAKVLNPRG